MIFRTIRWSIEAVSWVETAWNKMARGDKPIIVISKWMFYIAKLILEQSLISNPIITKKYHNNINSIGTRIFLSVGNLFKWLFKTFGLSRKIKFGWNNSKI